MTTYLIVGSDRKGEHEHQERQADATGRLKSVPARCVAGRPHLAPGVDVGAKVSHARSIRTAQAQRLPGGDNDLTLRASVRCSEDGRTFDLGQHTHVFSMPIADAHLHVWDPRAHSYPWLCDAEPIAFRYGDYSSLKRPYLLDDYRADSAGWDVRHGVYVEAEWDPRDPAGEMEFISGFIRNGFPTVAIGQAWLHRDDCAAVLESHSKHSFVRGIRHKPKPGMMDDAKWRTGYRRLAPHGLHFELQAPWRQLDEAARLAGDFPDTTIVLNHTGLPLDPEIDGWRTAMKIFSAHENVAVKISGLGNVTRKREVVVAAIELFGVNRAMFASNFPVDGLRASFHGIYSAFMEFTEDFSEPEKRALFHDNAVRIYRMEA
jgi:predicted TIM-barrel fold metal-dependent hydrolase